jgi:hypothetical protein
MSDNVIIVRALGARGPQGANAAGALTIEQVDSNGNVLNQYLNISTLQFDQDSGFQINSAGNIATVTTNNTFKYWEVNGNLELTANGLDTVNFISGPGISISADTNANSLTIATDSTIATQEYADQSSATAEQAAKDYASSLLSSELNIGGIANISGISATVNTNNNPVILDQQNLTTFLTVEYTVSIWQNSKYRSSKLLVQSNRSNVNFTEFAIVEMGGTINGPLLSVNAIGNNSVLSITMSDAIAYNATVKIVKTIIYS